MTKNLITALTIFALCGTLHAADWYASTNGVGVGTNWATAGSLTGMVAGAASGDVVNVSNGTYVVNLTVGGGVTVRGKTGLPEDVILDGEATGRVVTMAASSWLVGCTVTNGYLEDADGVGVYGGLVSNSIITGNTLNFIEGGGNGGAGIAYCTVYNSLIINNIAIGLNGGGGYDCTFLNSTITGNSADPGGGGYDCLFVNSISWDNSTADYFSGSWTNSYSCGIGYAGVGSITNDPLFVSASDFRLQAGSPCINTGTNGAWTAGARDLDGNQRIWPAGGTVDMGAYEYGSEPAYRLWHIWVKP